MPITRKCLNCKRAFSLPPCREKKGLGKFCCHKCYTDYRVSQTSLTITCLVCGKKFTRSGARAKSAKYCSWKCKDVGVAKTKQLMLTYATCLNCNNKFSTPPCKIKRGQSKYCSWDCRVAYMRKNGFPRSGIKHERHCEICGESFWVHPSDLKHTGFNRFCSQKCMIKWRSQTWIGENNPNWRDAMVDRTCRFCGKMFRFPKRQIVSKHTGSESGKFCSIECKNKSMVIVGSTDYRGDTWASQRRLARRRDNYICKICGKSRIDNYDALPVHHIIPFRLFRFESGKNHNDMFANQSENLITLCRKCHVKHEGKSPEFFRKYISYEQYSVCKDLEAFIRSAF